MGWWGSFLCWFNAITNGALLLWLLMGLAFGFLSLEGFSLFLNWGVAVGNSIPVVLVFLFVVPLVGLAGQVMTWGSSTLPPRIAGGAGLVFSVILWILLWVGRPKY